MESGPFRAPQPVERRVASREEAAPRAAEAPQPIVEAPRAASRAEPPEKASKKKSPRRRRFLLPLIIVIAVIVIAVAGYFVYNKAQNSATAINKNEYQAVFFTNGQVYFGKLQAFNSQYMKLTDIFYLQAQSSDSTDSSNPQSTSSDQSSNVQLIKLGNEVHGPEDEMVISKEQVLFYENLKSDGKVAQSIAKYKAN